METCGPFLGYILHELINHITTLSILRIHSVRIKKNLNEGKYYKFFLLLFSAEQRNLQESEI